MQVKLFPVVQILAKYPSPEYTIMQGPHWIPRGKMVRNSSNLKMNPKSYHPAITILAICHHNREGHWRLTENLTRIGSFEKAANNKLSHRKKWFHPPQVSRAGAVPDTVLCAPSQYKQKAKQTASNKASFITPAKQYWVTPLLDLKKAPFSQAVKDYHV